MKRLTSGAWMVGAAVLVAGCVQRTISVTSEPAGALVYLNDEEVGRTPVTVPFTFYGTYDVRLEKEGYRTLQTTQKARGPWWETPGPDLVAEAIPGRKVRLNWAFAMEPATAVDEARLVDRAQQMRALTNEGQSDPADQQKQSD